MGSTGISWQPDFSCNARGREQIVQARAPGPLYRTKPHITAPEEGSLMSSVEIPERLSIEPIQVARYRAFQETAGGFTLPSAQSTDRHVFFSLPGVVALPAMIYYRTRHFGKPAFSVRINDFTATQYTFVDGDEAERTWHEIIPASTNAGPTLRPENNELVFFARDGSVVFGDVVILYTSNQTTIPAPVATSTA